MPRDACAICDKELHSIITRRAGDFALCLDCGDTLGPLILAITNGIVERAKVWHETARDQIGKEYVNRNTMVAFANDELMENFQTLVPDAKALRQILR